MMKSPNNEFLRMYCVVKRVIIRPHPDYRIWPKPEWIISQEFKSEWFFSLFWSWTLGLNIRPAGVVLKFSYFYFLLFPCIYLYVLFPRIPCFIFEPFCWIFNFSFIFNSKLSCHLNHKFHFMDIIYFSKGMTYIVFFSKFLFSSCFYFDPCHVKWLSLDWWFL